MWFPVDAERGLGKILLEVEEEHGTSQFVLPPGDELISQDVAVLALKDFGAWTKDIGQLVDMVEVPVGFDE